MDDDHDMIEVYDGSGDSDEDGMVAPLGESYDALVPSPFQVTSANMFQRHALLIKDKTSVLTALKVLRKNSSEREGTLFHEQGMQVAARLAPEVINLFKIGDQDIQVCCAMETANVQDNASWVLVNISAGSLEQARTIITAGAIPLMVEKLKARKIWEGHQETELNIAWCFMNLATDREEFGKVLIAHGVLDLLVSFTIELRSDT